MTEPLDISALRAKLRVYDQTLPRCTKRIVRVSNHAPDYVAEEERAEWDMRLTYPCGELEGHEGQCREGRAILGWPGFKTMTALLDLVEAQARELERTEHARSSIDTALMLERERERAAVVAWLRGEPERLVACDGHRHADGKSCLVLSPMPAYELANAIERGEHRREED